MRHSTIKPSREMIAQASAWFIEFRTDNPNQAQRDRFNAWLCTSPQHIQAYFEVAAAWSELPDTDLEGRIDIQQMTRAARASSDANIVELSTRFKGLSTKPRFNFPLRLTAVAASLLVMLLGTTTYLYTQRGIYQTQTGEQRSLTLADGSSVELNAQSAIRVRYTDQERHIDLLKGQALFHVAKNKAKPFIVNTGDTQVRAVGTQFDVYRKSSGTIVTVVEGRVAVTTTVPANNSEAEYPDQVSAEADGSARDPSTLRDAQVFLAAGEQLTVSAMKPAAIQKSLHPDIDAATAWTQKRLVFEDTPLIDAAQEFNRYNTRPLIIADPELQRVGISGLYSSTDPTALLAFLNAQSSIRVTETETQIVITRKPN